MDRLEAARILIVDDQEPNRLLIQRILERDGYTDIAATGRSDEVRGIFEDRTPDLLLLDLQMPAPDGFAVMELLTSWTTGDTYVPILILTADASQGTRHRALQAGARDFLTKPLDAAEVSLRIRNLLTTRQLQLRLQAHNQQLENEVAQRTAELTDARVEAFHKLAIAAEYRDDDTRLHTRRVGRLAARLAAGMGCEPALVDAIEQAAPLHDLGKIGIPDAILLKPGKLSEEEFTVMQTHAQIGADIMADSPSELMTLASVVALTHHERWDGAGYPHGLEGDAIPLPGRIVALADAFDAMSHARPYKPAFALHEVLGEIDFCSGEHFDPAVVAVFNRLDPHTLLDAPNPAVTG